MRNVGLDVVAADNAVLSGIQTVAARLSLDPAGDPRLLVHRRCSNLIREFGSYEWMEHADGSMKDKPKKEHDHALDSLRYALVHMDGIRSMPSIRAIGDRFSESMGLVDPMLREDLWTEM